MDKWIYGKNSADSKYFQEYEIILLITISNMFDAFGLTLDLNKLWALTIFSCTLWEFVSSILLGIRFPYTRGPKKARKY